MATDVVLPALGMSQDTGRIVKWLKAEGDQVAENEPLATIETDKATVDIEAPAAGVLARILAPVDAEVPVGQIIATILAPGEVLRVPELRQALGEERTGQRAAASPDLVGVTRHEMTIPAEPARAPMVIASQLASRIAAEHHVDLSQVRSTGRRVQKSDVLAYLQSQSEREPMLGQRSLVLASPKARRLVREQGRDLSTIRGSGPAGAVLAADVLASAITTMAASEDPATMISAPLPHEAESVQVSTIWRLMAQRTTQSWQSAPHFYLVREVNASRLIAWRESFLARGMENITYTDLLVKIVAAVLRMHPRVNALWSDNQIRMHTEIHLGVAVAVEDGLVVPVIHNADKLGVRALAQQRTELVGRARAGKLQPQDISGGTFTLSNLGMYGVDAFNAIINGPQIAILAIGRIAERVVPRNGQPAVQPMMVITLSCDHRALDGTQGARFLDSIARWIEEPLGLLD